MIVEEEEEEDAELSKSVRQEMVTVPRDPYAERYFPSIIGSNDFITSERLGLMEYFSEGI